MVSGKGPGAISQKIHGKMYSTVFFSFPVENLSSSPVNSYKEIEAKIEEGTKNRTIAATNMNATSSRAHTIVKIIFTQKFPKSGGGTTTKKSEINLVDLAGRLVGPVQKKRLGKLIVKDNGTLEVKATA